MSFQTRNLQMDELAGARIACDVSGGEAEAAVAGLKRLVRKDAAGKLVQVFRHGQGSIGLSGWLVWLRFRTAASMRFRSVSDGQPAISAYLARKARQGAMAANLRAML